MPGNLRTVIGVDEAGYGPRLGPLVVALAAFRAPEDDLRSLLPISRDRKGPAPVDDSKRLYHGPGDLSVLERTVLGFGALSVSAAAPDPPREIPPWGLRHPLALPAQATPEEVERATTALREEAGAAGVEVLEIRSRTVGVEEFNREIDRLGNKATLLFEIAMELVGPWLEEAGDTRIHVDRQGGRAYYSPLLTERFPGRHHWIVGETSEVSVYRYPRPDGDATISFEVGGDLKHLPVALASMTAKYVRELHMRALNQHFGAAEPDLVPTAGYHGDAGRWLKDSAEVRRRLGVPEEALVRRR